MCDLRVCVGRLCASTVLFYIRDLNIYRFGCLDLIPGRHEGSLCISGDATVLSHDKICHFELERMNVTAQGISASCVSAPYLLYQPSRAFSATGQVPLLPLPAIARALMSLRTAS